MKYLWLSALFLLVSCDRPEKTLKVIATPVPHAVMLEEVAKPLLRQEGIDLEIIVVEDYYLPNRALAAGEADANFFQHELFLAKQIEHYGYKLTVLAPVHIEPMGLYSARYKDLQKIKTVAIPIDPSNKARALLLLEKAGLHPTEIMEVDGVMLPRTYEELDAAVIPTNYALQIGLKPDSDALIREEGDSPYANVLVVREGDETRLELLALKKALTGPELEHFIETYYEGALEPSYRYKRPKDPGSS